MQEIKRGIYHSFSDEDLDDLVRNAFRGEEDYPKFFARVSRTSGLNGVALEVAARRVLEVDERKITGLRPKPSVDTSEE
jgi:hypothetical protein